MLKVLLCVTTAAVALISCKPYDDSAMLGRLEALEKSLKTTQDRAQKASLEALLVKMRLDSLEGGTATVHPDDKLYDVARTKHGPFLVSIEDVSPYLDGFKVKVRIGNMTAAAFSGLKATIEWGPPWDPDKPEVRQNGLKKKQISSTSEFRAGSFTYMDAVLTPAKPEEIRVLNVNLAFDEVLLRK